MDIEGIMLSEISQKEKDKYYVSLLIYTGTLEPGGLPSMGSHRVGRNQVTQQKADRNVVSIYIYISGHTVQHVGS